MHYVAVRSILQRQFTRLDLSRAEDKRYSKVLYAIDARATVFMLCTIVPDEFSIIARKWS